MNKQNNYQKRSYEVLKGLSVGDAFGESFSYGYERIRERLKDGMPEVNLWWTDDTAMAIGIHQCLTEHGKVKQDALAKIFHKNYLREPDRGYGRMAAHMLSQMNKKAWQLLTTEAFDGGSMGNGSAMRIPPLGVWFAEDYDTVVKQAKLSAQITHFHPEGIAGAIAVALTSAAAFNTRNLSAQNARSEIHEVVMSNTPKSATKEMITSSFSIGLKKTIAEAVSELGNGANITCVDTVPFVIWNSLRCLDDLKEGMLSSVEAGGDCDTNTAMVAGIITARLGEEALPQEWMKKLEKLPV